LIITLNLFAPGKEPSLAKEFLTLLIPLDTQKHKHYSANILQDILLKQYFRAQNHKKHHFDMLRSNLHN